LRCTQGFASGDLDADAAAQRMFAAATAGLQAVASKSSSAGRPMEMLLAQSFAKNMGL
jgi:aspartate/tyrosine/aromatic aminotransferase